MTIRLNWRIMTLALVAAILILFIAANTHLVYVAVSSQPDCVPHQKEAGSGFQAAKPAC